MDGSNSKRGVALVAFVLVIAASPAPASSAGSTLPDPLLQYSSLFGGRMSDRIEDIALATNGDVIVVGRTQLVELPTTATRGRFRIRVADREGTYRVIAAEAQKPGASLEHVCTKVISGYLRHAHG